MVPGTHEGVGVQLEFPLRLAVAHTWASSQTHQDHQPSPFPLTNIETVALQVFTGHLKDYTTSKSLGGGGGCVCVCVCHPHPHPLPSLTVTNITATAITITIIIVAAIIP